MLSFYLGVHLAYQPVYPLGMRPSISMVHALSYYMDRIVFQLENQMISS